MDQNKSSGGFLAAADGRWTARNSAGYEAPAALAVDVVVLTVRAGELLVLIIESAGTGPALPGGFVGPDETPAETAARKLSEKTGLSEDLYLEQLATFAAPDRDPRGWIPSVAHLALVPPATEANRDCVWVPATTPPPLAYDHDLILATAIERVQGKLWWSNVAVGILPRDFTLAQARLIYDAISGTTYDPSTFARDLRATGLIEAAGSTPVATGGRPAALFRFSARAPAWGTGRRKRIR